MDMVGRLTDQLVLQGVSSSSIWPSVIESKNAVVGLPVTLSNETDLPTDASSFYRGGIPILSAFTGSHTDYHTPRDTPEKLNYPDAARIARLMGLITRSLATTDETPDYIEQSSAPQDTPKGGLRAYLGSVPAYGEDVVGVKLSDVTKGAPADTAGIKGGDIIVELAGKSIENIYDYTAIIDAIKIGEETTVTVLRNGQRVELKITPGSRQ
jgi:C-terminal processing protease CtpA/Prc